MHILDNRFDLATQVLDHLYLIEPNNPEIFIQKANILSKSDRHQLAIELLKHAVSLTDDHADILNLIGMEYLFCDQYADALNNFLKCLAIDSCDDAALYNVIYCFEFLNQEEEAIAFLNGYLEIEPYNQVAWHQLGKLYADLGRSKDALQAFDFAIISNDQFIGAYLEKGKLLEKSGRIEEAIDLYLLTLTLDDPTSYAYYRLGRCYQLIANDSYALKYYKLAVEEDPLYDKAWFCIIDLYLGKGYFDEALFHAEKAVDVDPDNAVFWYKYALANSKSQMLEEAEYGYRRSIELGNFELSLWLDRADILFKLGELSAAILSLEQALEIHPQTCSLLYRLAALHYIKGSFLKGRFYLDTALRNDAEREIFSDFFDLFPELIDHSELNFLKTA
jgi:tetratricopeptide (TPR) repeat protein